MREASLSVAEMTPGSHQATVISRRGIGRSHCMCRQEKLKIDNICYFLKPTPKSPNCSKSPCFWSNRRFGFKRNPLTMEHTEPTGDHAAEVTDGRLGQLTSKWFIETQVPLMVNNGLFPSWFLGLITRQESENILRKKELGCFLVRLSDKAIGYILSYKGRDRCRHFVISQNESGQFVVCGDTEEHSSMHKLLEHYKTNPIEPFGEYLTSSCFEVLSEELYDVIQVSPNQSMSSAPKGAKTAKKPQSHQTPEPQPTHSWPNTSQNHKEVPTLPQRIKHPDSDTTSEVNVITYAQLKKQTPSEASGFQHLPNERLPFTRKTEKSPIPDQGNGRNSPPCDAGSPYSELSLLDAKCRSLPQLRSSSDGEQSYRLSVPPATPPRLSPKPVRQGSPRTHPAREGRPASMCNLDNVSDSGIYHLVGRPASCSPRPCHSRSVTPEEGEESVYAEVKSGNGDDTYEPLPGHTESLKPEFNNHAYVHVEDKRRKHNINAWAKKNDKWKWLFPETKKKL